MKGLVLKEEKGVVRIRGESQVVGVRVWIMTLAARTQSIPGTPASNPPIVAPQSAIKTAPIDARSMEAQTTLVAGKDQLAMTQEMLMIMQANYTKTTDMLLEQQKKLGNIQADLTCLANSNVSLVSIHHSTKKLLQCSSVIRT